MDEIINKWTYSPLVWPECTRQPLQTYNQHELPREQQQNVSLCTQGCPSILSVVLKHQGMEPSKNKCKKCLSLTKQNFP